MRLTSAVAKLMRMYGLTAEEKNVISTVWSQTNEIWLGYTLPDFCAAYERFIEPLESLFRRRLLIRKPMGDGERIRFTAEGFLYLDPEKQKEAAEGNEKVIDALKLLYKEFRGKTVNSQQVADLARIETARVRRLLTLLNEFGLPIGVNIFLEKQANSDQITPTHEILKGVSFQKFFEAERERHAMTVESSEKLMKAHVAPSVSKQNKKKDLRKGPALARAKKVFVVHGRNGAARKAMWEFLVSLGLEPIEWEEAVRQTGSGAPYVGQVLNAAFKMAAAVVVLLTPDDEGRLRPEYHEINDPSYEKNLTPQARPNVIFEAGMALGRHPERTILVEIGNTRPFSDIGGRHTLRFDGSREKREALKERLRQAGCPIQDSDGKWITAGDFNATSISLGSRTYRRR